MAHELRPEIKREIEFAIEREAHGTQEGKIAAEQQVIFLQGHKRVLEADKADLEKRLTKSEAISEARLQDNLRLRGVELQLSAKLKECEETLKAHKIFISYKG